MPKIIKEPAILLPLSDWDNPNWNREMFVKHEREFLEIEREFRAIRHHEPSVIASRYYWLEKKGAVRLFRNEKGNFDVTARDSYGMYSNMFSRYSEWKAEKERREMSPEARQAMIREIGKDLPKMSFGIPPEIRQRAAEDLDFDNSLQKI
jgi:hypothetical protein